MTTGAGLPTVAQLAPLVLSAIRDAGGTATTNQIRQRVESSFEPSLTGVRHRGGRGGEIAYRIRWAILDLRRHGAIARVAPKTYAVTSEARNPT